MRDLESTPAQPYPDALARVPAWPLGHEGRQAAQVLTNVAVREPRSRRQAPHFAGRAGAAPPSDRKAAPW